jgi:hypothetical protein
VVETLKTGSLPNGSRLETQCSRIFAGNQTTARLRSANPLDGNDGLLSIGIRHIGTRLCEWRNCAVWLSSWASHVRFYCRSS